MSDLYNGLHELVRQDNDRLRKENEELRAKDICTCDEINSRHCQYHQELADLQKENEELKEFIKTEMEPLSERNIKLNEENASLRESLKDALWALEQYEKYGACSDGNLKSKVIAAKIKAKHGDL
jgi:cell division protein FtsB